MRSLKLRDHYGKWLFCADCNFVCCDSNFPSFLPKDLSHQFPPHCLFDQGYCHSAQLRVESTPLGLLIANQDRSLLPHLERPPKQAKP